MDDAPSKTLTASAVLSIGGARVRVEMTVPSGPVPLAGVLTAVRSMALAIIDQAERDELEQGRAVSCRKGCGACCRQLVPIAEVEAVMIRDLVEALPEAERLEVRARFAEAGRRLLEAGLRDGILHPERLTLERARTVGLDYFRLGLPCPFLVDESCSIHEVRPIACREYLVTSGPEHCAHPTAETVRCVPLPGQVSAALRKVGTDGTASSGPWVPLALALEWAEARGDEPPSERPGPEWLGEVVRHLTGARVPPAPGSSA